MYKHHSFYSRWIGIVCSFLLLCACEVQLHSGLAEQEANEMVSILQMHSISVKKKLGKKGTVNLMVQEDELSMAVEILKSNGYPKTQFQDLCSVFTKKGMISSPLEEKARYVCAKSQEIAQTLSDIDGVITARVHVVLPESDKMGDEIQPSSASVYIKHKREIRIKENIPQIKHLVQNSIESLDYEKITIALFPAEDTLAQMSGVMPVSGVEALSDDGALLISKPILFVLTILFVVLASICCYLFLAWSKMAKKAK